MQRIALVAVMLTVACGDSTGPSTRVPSLGRYAYESEWTGTGTMTITFASADSVAATFDVGIPSRSLVMRGPAKLGFWNQDAYVLYGDVEITVRTGSTTNPVTVFREQYVHRIRWDAVGAICTVQEVFNANRGLRPCTLRFLGP